MFTVLRTYRFLPSLLTVGLLSNSAALQVNSWCSMQDGGQHAVHARLDLTADGAADEPSRRCQSVDYVQTEHPYPASPKVGCCCKVQQTQWATVPTDLSRTLLHHSLPPFQFHSSQTIQNRVGRSPSERQAIHSISGSGTTATERQALLAIFLI